MIRLTTISTLAMAVSLGWAAPVQAQSAAEVTAMRAEMAAMRDQMAAMASKIDALETEMAVDGAETQAQIAAATGLADNAVRVADAANVTAARVADAAPLTRTTAGTTSKLSKDGGWSFTPYGRLMVDAGSVNAPDAITDDGLGFANEVRRARLGVKGDIGGGFDYKMEFELAGGDVEITDAILGYDAGAVKIQVGQQNNFQSLAELTSSRFMSFMERAAFTDAFGFKRRVGISGTAAPGDVLIQGGIFTDNIADMDDGNNSWSADGRVVYAPKLGDAQLHLGGSLHYREFNDASSTVRYRQRPQAHFTDVRFTNTDNFSAMGETGYGLEAAILSGQFHAHGEAFWQEVTRPGVLVDPTFFGGFAEAGYFLTSGDQRGYKGGKFDRIKPVNPVGEGGIGAVQIVARYDYLDLNDGGIMGGKQDNFGLSLIWTPTDYTRFMMNYIHGKYDDAAIAAGTDTDYNVDTFGMRAQFDF